VLLDAHYCRVRHNLLLMNFSFILGRHWRGYQTGRWLKFFFYRLVKGEVITFYYFCYFDLLSIKINWQFDKKLHYMII
jgi:hypothetical protein